MGFFSEERKGDIIARMSGDVERWKTHYQFIGHVDKEPYHDYIVFYNIDCYQLEVNSFHRFGIAGYGLADG